jgi:hypothetical protein
MMKAISTSETSVNVYQTTRRNKPEASHIHARRRENLKYHKVRILMNALVVRFKRSYLRLESLTKTIGNVKKDSMLTYLIFEIGDSLKVYYIELGGILSAAKPVLHAWQRSYYGGASCFHEEDPGAK